jgi:hypothetical protein
MTFAADGYAIAPLFTPAQIASLRAVIADHMERIARALFLPHAETEPGAPYDERIERLAQRDPSAANLLGAAIATDAHRSDAVAAVLDDPRFTAQAEEFMGSRIRGRTIRFRGNSSTLSDHRHRWHSDVVTVDGGACSTVKLTAWIPLADAGPETGGLELATGRRDAPLPHTQGNGRFSIDDALLAGAPKVQPDVHAGSCLFMDRFMPHRTLPNLSGKTRWSLAVWMKPA